MVGIMVMVGRIPIGEERAVRRAQAETQILFAHEQAEQIQLRIAAGIEQRLQLARGEIHVR